MNSRQQSATAIALYRLRLEALRAYGGVCACCGERRAVLLTLDHIVPVGKARIPLNTRLADLRFREWPAASGLQVLCYNCNMNKRAEAACDCKENRLTVEEALATVPRKQTHRRPYSRPPWEPSILNLG